MTWKYNFDPQLKKPIEEVIRKNTIISSNSLIEEVIKWSF